MNKGAWLNVVSALALAASVGCDAKSSQDNAVATTVPQATEGSQGQRAKGESVAIPTESTPMASAATNTTTVDHYGSGGLGNGIAAPTATAVPPPADKAAAPHALARPMAPRSPAGPNGNAYADDGLDPQAAAHRTPATTPRSGAVIAQPEPPTTMALLDNRPKEIPVAANPVLDRNARYATTYRPGGAALAAFDAALSKGSIPTTYKDLVGDFGGRYAPSLSVPSGAAMAFQIDEDRSALAPSGGLVNLRIAMRSSDAMPTRAPLSVHLVLDISGSMQGVAIENAKQAAETLVKKLEPADDFSMVIFSDEANVLVNDGAVGPRKDRILSAISKVQAEGGTNISAGLDLGYKLAHTPSIDPDAVKIVMFLSDGHANAGDTNPVQIAGRSAKAFQDGIQTSSFGLGADFDAQIMSSVADQGAGGYYYLADSSQISPALSRELDARLVPVAQAVEVRLRLRPEVTPRKVFGSRVLDKQEAAQVRAQEVAVDTQVAKRDNIKRDRQTDAEGGMRFFMPAFARDDRHAMLITVEVPEGTGDARIGSVEIKYKDRIAKKNVTQEIPITVKYAASDAESAATTNASVAATVQAFAAGDAILKAADLIDIGNRPYASQVLRERAELLKRASSMLEEPRLGEEGLRLARLSLAVNGDQKIQDPLPLALMLRGSGYGYLK